MLLEKTLSQIKLEDFFKNLEKIINPLKKLERFNYNLITKYNEVYNIFIYFPNIINRKSISEYMQQTKNNIRDIKRANIFLQFHILERIISDFLFILLKEMGANICIENIPEIGKNNDIITTEHIYDTFSVFGEINIIWNISSGKFVIWYKNTNDAEICHKFVNGNKIGDNIIKTSLFFE